MNNRWIPIAAFFGLSGVAAGAFAAHALADRLQPDALKTVEVAVRYQMYHALALLAVAWLAAGRPSRVVAAAGMCMVSGILLFSGSLYLLALCGWMWLGPVTPVGGTLFLAAWILLGIAGMKPTAPKGA